MQLDTQRRLFRPQRHNTPLVTTLGLIFLMSEIENIIAMISNQGVMLDLHQQNLFHVLKTRRLKDFLPDPQCQVCAGNVVDIHSINAAGSTAVACVQCGGFFHKTCIDETPQFVAPADWICYCCKRSEQVQSADWKRDLSIEQQVKLPATSCQVARRNVTYILDGVVRVWKGDACMFFIAGTEKS